MRISVFDNAGTECFSYDTDKRANCLHPNMGETPRVIEALREATRFLSPPARPNRITPPEGASS